MTRFELAFAIVVGSAFGLTAAVVADRTLPTSPVVRGLAVGGLTVPVRRIEAWLVARDAEVRSRAVRLRAGDRVFSTTLGEAGVSLDVGATLTRAERVGHEGSLGKRIRDASAARRGAIDLPLVYRLDEAKTKALLAGFAGELFRAPVDAHLDLDRHEKTPDVPGVELDIEASAHLFAELRHEGGETIDLVMRTVAATVTAEALGKVDITKVVSAFETNFSIYGSGAGRAVNIQKAASLLDGMVLAPHQVLSFNDRVGARTKERGFAIAPEIQGDEMQLGIGGGTCQVSSTLHVAAVYGALDVVERQSHSRPSAYAMLGLDATVSYPTTDLKIENSMPFPIMIHAFLPKPTAVRVEILGGDPIATVVYGYGVNSSEDFVRRIEVKANLPAGRTIRHQKGSRGYDITSVVKIRYLDGHTDERHYFSGYKPAPEILYVAPGTTEAEMPPLPDHAKGVEKKRVSTREGREGDPDAYSL